MGKNKKSKKKKNRRKNERDYGKMSSRQEAPKTNKGIKRTLTCEEVGSKHQKCTTENQQFHDGTVGQTSDTDTSQFTHTCTLSGTFANERAQPSEKQYPRAQVLKFQTNF